jgi:hypothetical protein
MCSRHYHRWRTYGDPLAVRRTRGACAVEDCGVPAKSRGWCRVHYGRWYDYGDPLAVASRVRAYGGALCGVEGCDAEAAARGWCWKHYQAWRKWGDPLGSVPERPVRLCDYPGCEGKHRTGGYCESHARQARDGRPVGPILPPSERHRLYTLDHGYFDEISDEHRAYWLGFITADGCVTQPEGRRILQVQLKASDGGHLRTMCDDLGSDRPVIFSKRSEASVAFNSEPIADALARVGIGPRKTGIVEPWDGPAELMPHYWRGMVDGDGCLHRQSRNGKWALSLVGSEACVRGFAAWAHEMCGSDARPQLAQGCWYWAVGGTYKPQMLARALYAGADIALPRKQALADTLCAVDFTERRVSAECRRVASYRETVARRRGAGPKKP